MTERSRGRGIVAAPSPMSPVSPFAVDALPPRRGLPLVVYVHRALVFTAAIMRCDAISLGYMALFLFSSVVLSTDRYWCYGISAADQMIGRRRSGATICGVGFSLGGYTVTAILWSVGSFVGHIAMDTIAHSGKEKVLDPVLFVMLVSVLVDVLTLISAIGVLKAARAASATLLAADFQNRFATSSTEDQGLHQFYGMHFLSIVIAALSPCITTSIYFLFYLSNIWELSSGPVTGRLAALRGRGRLLGAFAAVHVLMLYAVQVFGKALDLDCTLSSLLGLPFREEFEVSTWVVDSAILLLFLTSFAVGQEVGCGASDRRRADVEQQSDASAFAAAPALQGGGRRAEMREPLMADDGAAAGAAGGAGLRGAVEDGEQPAGGRARWLGIKWDVAGWVLAVQGCGAVLIGWSVLFAGVLEVPLLGGGALLVAAPMLGVRARVLGALLAYTALLLAAQFGAQTWLAPKQPCEPAQDLSQSVLSLLGLVRFEESCGLGGHGEAWPNCAGINVVVTQQLGLHMLAVVVQHSRRMLASADGQAHVMAGGAGMAWLVDHVGTAVRWERAVRRARAWLRVATVGVMLCTGLGAADGLHCGYLVMSVALCVSARVSRRLWPAAMVGVALAMVLTYIWHFDHLLPLSAVWGLGLKRDLPVWSWSVAGAHLANFLLLVLAYAPPKQPSRQALAADASSRALPADVSPSEGRAQEDTAPERVDGGGVLEEEVEGGWIGLESIGLEVVQEQVGRAWKEGERQAWRAWKSLGYVIVIGAMLLHGLELTLAGEWLLLGLPTHPTIVNLFYLWGMLVLVLLHTACGWEDLALLRALPVWYFLIPTASLLLAARYIAQFELVSGWLLQQLGQDVMEDLGVAKAASGDLFLDLVGDAVLVGLMTGQPSRLRTAAKQAGRTQVEAFWKGLWRAAGCLPLQLALCQAGYQDHSVLGMGYVVLLVFALLLPAPAARMWGLPHLFAQASCLCKFVVQLHVVQSWLAARLPQCPDDEQNCFLDWLGLRIEAERTPTALMGLMGSDLIVLLATCVVVPLDLSGGLPAEEDSSRAAEHEETGSTMGWWRRQLKQWVDSRVMVPLTYHLAVGALLVASHLADTVMCLLLLAIFLSIIITNNGTVRVWKSVNLLLGCLLVAWKVMQLLNKNPDWTSAPQVELRATCLYRWLGLLPQSAYEDERNTIAFVLPMICISLHVRALLQAPGISAEQSILVLSPRMDPDFSFAAEGSSAPTRRRSREVPMQGTNARRTEEEQGQREEEEGAKRAMEGEVEAGAWKLWAMTQTTIFVGVLLLFYLFSSAVQSLATAMVLLTILHAMYEQACIRALCLRLNLLLLLLLAVDSLFQVPIPLLYSNNNDYNHTVPVIPGDGSPGQGMWRQVCLGNATRVARFAQAAGIDVGLGMVALRPIVALLVVMALRQLLLSTWYQQLELLVADESTRTEQKGRAWVAAERGRRAVNIEAGERELLQSRNRVQQLRKLLGGSDESVAKIKKNLHTNMRTYFTQFGGGQGEASLSEKQGEEAEASEPPSEAEAAKQEESYLSVGVRAALKMVLSFLTGSLQKSGLATRKEAEHAARIHRTPGRGLVLDVWWDRDGTGHSRGAGVLSPLPSGDRIAAEASTAEGGEDGDGQQPQTLWELVLGVGEALAATFSLNTHLVSYSAIVIWHCFGSLPASGLLVVFVLSVAAFQDPFPARWHWTVSMGYLVLLAACKIVARLLAERFCEDPGESVRALDQSPWLCEALMPSWFAFAGDESGPGIGDFATLLVLAAHRANLQHRGLWRDVGILEFAPRSRRAHRETRGAAQAESEGQEDEGRGDVKEAPADGRGEGQGAEEGAAASTGREAAEAGGVGGAGGQSEGENATESRRASVSGSGRRGSEADWVKRTQDLFWLPWTSNGEFGTGVDLYMLVVTPELLALLLFFVGILGSGAGAQDKLENLSQGGAVDWSTLGWVMLAFLQWLNIVVDRIMYLRRLIWAKAMLQIATVLFFFAIFFLNMQEPLLAEPSPSFYTVLYLLKCWYWVASAVQIRRGYPAITRENYFFKDFSTTSSYLYIVYTVIPFLMDMRGMLDWTCTPTTLDFYQWMKLEAIYAMLFQRQVVLSYRARLGRRFGQAQLYLMKVFTGLLYFVGLAIVIWAPLLISVVSSKYASPQMIPVLGVQLDVSLATGLGDLFPLSSLSAVSQHLLEVPSTCPASSFYNVTDWLSSSPRQQQAAVSALQEECALKDSFTTIRMTSEGSMWVPTPVRKRQLLRALEGNFTTVHLLLQANYIRNTTGIPQASTGQKEYQSKLLGTSKSHALDETQRTALAMVLANGEGQVVLPGVLDPMVQLTADTAAPLRYGMQTWRQGVTLVLNQQPSGWWMYADEKATGLEERRTVGMGVGGSDMWWSVCCAANSSYCDMAAGGDEGCGPLWFLAANDPGSINVLSRLGLSLITIYTIFVLAIGRSVRSICTGDVPLTMYNELPAIDKLWSLCSDIYTARHHGDLDLEEELFTFLVDIYRSPDNLLQLTGMGPVGSDPADAAARDPPHGLAPSQGSIAV